MIPRQIVQKLIMLRSLTNIVGISLPVCALAE